MIRLCCVGEIEPLCKLQNGGELLNNFYRKKMFLFCFFVFYKKRKLRILCLSFQERPLSSRYKISIILLRQKIIRHLIPDNFNLRTRACSCVCVRTFVCVCVCLCERDMLSVCVREREREREKKRKRD